MGLMQRALELFGLEQRDDRRDPSWGAIAPGIGYTGVMSARAAENLSAVLACTTAISSALAYVPPLVYRRDSDGNRVEAPTHPLARVVRSGVNEQQTWPDWLEHVVSSALLTGNGLAQVMWGANGQLAGFRWIPWGTVSVVYLQSGRLAYDVTDSRGNLRRLLQDEVLHLRDRTDDGLVGRSRLSRAADVVAGVDASNAYARAFLENGARPGGIISYEGNLTNEQAQGIRDRMAERHGGPRRAGGTLILERGLTWQAASMSPEDSELLATRKFGIEEICRLFQVPPPLVQDYSHNTFTNSETAGRWFAQFTLAPMARKIEAEFARTVLAAGYELELDLSGFLRGDPQTRWAAHKIAIESGVLDPEEVRQVEGWNRRKKEPANGDEA
jgi:HK97 family phage portal protein